MSNHLSLQDAIRLSIEERRQRNSPQNLAAAATQGSDNDVARGWYSTIDRIRAGYAGMTGDYAREQEILQAGQTYGPRVGGFGQVKSLGDLADFTQGMLGASAPASLAAMGTTAAVIGSGGAAVPAFLAGTAAGAAMHAPENFLAQREAGVAPENRSVGRAVGTAVVQGALELAPGAAELKGAAALAKMSKAERAAVLAAKGQELAQQTAGRVVGKSIGGQVAEEGITEGATNVLNLAQTQGLDGAKTYSAKDYFNTFIEGLAGGAFLGGVMGGPKTAGELLLRQNALKETTSNQQPQPDQRPQSDQQPQPDQQTQPDQQPQPYQQPQPDQQPTTAVARSQSLLNSLVEQAKALAAEARAEPSKAAEQARVANTVTEVQRTGVPVTNVVGVSREPATEGDIVYIPSWAPAQDPSLGEGVDQALAAGAAVVLPTGDPAADPSLQGVLSRARAQGYEAVLYNNGQSTMLLPAQRVEGFATYIANTRNEPVEIIGGSVQDDLTALEQIANTAVATGNVELAGAARSAAQQIADQHSRQKQEAQVESDPLVRARKIVDSINQEVFAGLDDGADQGLSSRVVSALSGGLRAGDIATLPAEESLFAVKNAIQAAAVVRAERPLTQTEQQALVGAGYTAADKTGSTWVPAATTGAEASTGFAALQAAQRAGTAQPTVNQSTDQTSLDAAAGVASTPDGASFISPTAQGSQTGTTDTSLAVRHAQQFAAALQSLPADKQQQYWDAVAAEREAAKREKRPQRPVPLPPEAQVTTDPESTPVQPLTPDEAAQSARLAEQQAVRDRVTGNIRESVQARRARENALTGALAPEVQARVAVAEAITGQPADPQTVAKELRAQQELAALRQAKQVEVAQQQSRTALDLAVEALKQRVGDAVVPILDAVSRMDLSQFSEWLDSLGEVEANSLAAALLNNPALPFDTVAEDPTAKLALKTKAQRVASYALALAKASSPTSETYSAMLRLAEQVLTGKLASAAEATTDIQTDADSVTRWSASLRDMVKLIAEEYIPIMQFSSQAQAERAARTLRAMEQDPQAVPGSFQALARKFKLAVTAAFFPNAIDNALYRTRTLLDAGPLDDLGNTPKKRRLALKRMGRALVDTIGDALATKEGLQALLQHVDFSSDAQVDRVLRHLGTLDGLPGTKVDEWAASLTPRDRVLMLRLVDILQQSITSGVNPPKRVAEALKRFGARSQAEGLYERLKKDGRSNKEIKQAVGAKSAVKNSLISAMATQLAEQLDPLEVARDTLSRTVTSYERAATMLLDTITAVDPSSVIGPSEVIDDAAVDSDTHPEPLTDQEFAKGVDLETPATAPEETEGSLLDNVLSKLGLDGTFSPEAEKNAVLRGAQLRLTLDRIRKTPGAVAVWARALLSTGLVSLKDPETGGASGVVPDLVLERARILAEDQGMEPAKAMVLAARQTLMEYGNLLQSMGAATVEPHDSPFGAVLFPFAVEAEGKMRNQILYLRVDKLVDALGPAGQQVLAQFNEKMSFRNKKAQANLQLLHMLRTLSVIVQEGRWDSELVSQANGHFLAWLARQPELALFDSATSLPVLYADMAYGPASVAAAEAWRIRRKQAKWERGRVGVVLANLAIAERKAVAAMTEELRTREITREDGSKQVVTEYRTDDPAADWELLTQQKTLAFLEAAIDKHRESGRVFQANSPDAAHAMREWGKRTYEAMLTDMWGLAGLWEQIRGLSKEELKKLPENQQRLRSLARRMAEVKRDQEAWDKYLVGRETPPLIVLAADLGILKESDLKDGQSILRELTIRMRLDPADPRIREWGQNSSATFESHPAFQRLAQYARKVRDTKAFGDPALLAAFRKFARDEKTYYDPVEFYQTAPVVEANRIIERGVQDEQGQWITQVELNVYGTDKVEGMFDYFRMARELEDSNLLPDSLGVNSSSSYTEDEFYGNREAGIDDMASKLGVAYTDSSDADIKTMLLELEVAMKDGGSLTRLSLGELLGSDAKFSVDRVVERAWQSLLAAEASGELPAEQLQRARSQLVLARQLLARGAPVPPSLLDALGKELGEEFSRMTSQVRNDALVIITGTSVQAGMARARLRELGYTDVWAVSTNDKNARTTLNQAILKAKDREVMVVDAGASKAGSRATLAVSPSEYVDARRMLRNGAVLDTVVGLLFTGSRNETPTTRQKLYARAWFEKALVAGDAEALNRVAAAYYQRKDANAVVAARLKDMVNRAGARLTLRNIQEQAAAADEAAGAESMAVQTTTGGLEMDIPGPVAEEIASTGRRAAATTRLRIRLIKHIRGRLEQILADLGVDYDLTGYTIKLPKLSLPGDTLTFAPAEGLPATSIARINPATKTLFVSPRLARALVRKMFTPEAVTDLNPDQVLSHELGHAILQHGLLTPEMETTLLKAWLTTLMNQDVYNTRYRLRVREVLSLGDAGAQLEAAPDLRSLLPKEVESLIPPTAELAPLEQLASIRNSLLTGGQTNTSDLTQMLGFEEIAADILAAARTRAVEDGMDLRSAIETIFDVYFNNPNLHLADSRSASRSAELTESVVLALSQRVDQARSVNSGAATAGEAYDIADGVPSGEPDHGQPEGARESKHSGADAAPAGEEAQAEQDRAHAAKTLAGAWAQVDFLGEAKTLMPKLLSKKAIDALARAARSYRLRPVLEQFVRSSYPTDQVQKVLAQFKSDPMAAVALLIQARTVGVEGLDLSPRNQSILLDWWNGLKKMLGRKPVSEASEDLVRTLVADILSERVAPTAPRVYDINLELRDTMLQRLGNRAADLMKPLEKALANRYVYSVAGALKDMNNPYIDQIIDQFMTLNEAGEPGMFTEREQRLNQLMNIVSPAIEKLSKEELAQVGRLMAKYQGNFGAGLLNNPEYLALTEDQKKALRAFNKLFEETYKYANENGVEFNKVGDGTYYPLVFDPDWFADNAEQVKALLLDRFPDKLEEIRKRVNRAIEEQNKRRVERIKPALVGLSEEERAARIEAAKLPLKETLEEVVDDLLENIVDRDGLFEEMLKEGASTDFTPAFRFSNHADLRFLMDDDQSREFIIQGLVTDPAQVVTAYVRQATRRVEFVRRFGERGSVINELLSKALQHDPNLDVDMVWTALEALDGTLGRRTAAKLARLFGKDPVPGEVINPKLKAGLGWYSTYLYTTMLALATVISFTDIIGITARTGSVETTLRAVGQGLKAVFKGDNGKLQAFAHRLGVVSSAAIEDVLHTRMDNTFMRGGASRVTNGFFKIIGMQWWDRTARTMAVAAGQMYLLGLADAPAGDPRVQVYLGELGLTKEDITLVKGEDGTLDLFNPERLQDSEFAAASRRVQQAMAKLADQMIVRPNAAAQPAYFADPHFQLMKMLKSFQYTFWNNIVKRLGRELELGNSMALVGTAAVAIPMAVIMTMIQDLIKGYEDPEWRIQKYGLGSYLVSMVNKSGLMGPLGFVEDFAGSNDLVHASSVLFGPWVSNVASWASAANYMASQTNTAQDASWQPFGYTIPSAQGPAEDVEGLRRALGLVPGSTIIRPWVIYGTPWERILGIGDNNERRN